MKKEIKNIITVIPSIMAGKEAVKLLDKLRDMYYIKSFGLTNSKLMRISYKRTFSYKLLQTVTFIGVANLTYDQVAKPILLIIDDVARIIKEKKEGETDGGNKDNGNQAE